MSKTQKIFLNNIFFAGLILLGLLSVNAFAAPNSQSDTFYLEQRGIGNKKAPLLIIEEYASLTCPHCAAFHKNIFPLLKKDYIDTGKIYFVYSDYPWDRRAMEAAAAARCMPENSFFAFIGKLFDAQEEWAYKDDYRAKIVSMAKDLGGDGVKIEKCMDDDAIKTAITEKVSEAEKLYKVEETPSFVVNGAEKMNCEKSYDCFQKYIDSKIRQDK